MFPGVFYTPPPVFSLEYSTHLLLFFPWSTLHNSFFFPWSTLHNSFFFPWSNLHNSSYVLQIQHNSSYVLRVLNTTPPFFPGILYTNPPLFSLEYSAQLLLNVPWSIQHNSSFILSGVLYTTSSCSWSTLKTPSS